MSWWFWRAGILGHQEFLCYWLAYLFTYLDDKKPLQVRAPSCTHPCQVNPKYTTCPQEPFIWVIPGLRLETSWGTMKPANWVNLCGKLASFWQRLMLLLPRFPRCKSPLEYQNSILYFVVSLCTNVYQRF